MNTSTRQQRLTELVHARRRLDARINLLRGITETTLRRADLARRLVQSGWTHAEVAEHLDTHPVEVARLVTLGRRP